MVQISTIQSANHVAESETHKAMPTCDQEVRLSFRPNVRMGTKCELSYFDHEKIVGAKESGLSISEAADLL